MKKQENPTSAYLIEQPDFILHLQSRLNVSPVEARTLLAGWMQEFAPVKASPREVVAGRRAG